MNALHRFSAIVVADLRERSRSTRFWVVLAIVGIVTWWCFPPVEAGYMTISVGNGVRAHYSSAWIGMVLALMYASVMPLFGFYLVRGTLVRDFDTRVWQLLVATPMTRAGYLLAKWASHLAVFGLIMALGLVVGLAAQWWRGEVGSFDLIELVEPVLWLSLPSLAVTAMLAVLFDLVPWLRRSAGNVLYFVLWVTLFGAWASAIDSTDSWGADTWFSDPNGIALALRDLRAYLAGAYPDIEVGGLNIGANVFSGGATLFEWNAWSPGAADLAGRLLWVVISMLGVVAMAPMLDRAAARLRTPAANTSHGPGRRLRWLDVALRPLEHLPLGVLLAAELKLVLRQRRLWWWLALCGLAGVQLLGGTQALAIACIGAWLLSTDVLARAALREHESGTAALVFSAAHARVRMLPVRSVVALVMTVVPVLPALLRLVVTDRAMAAALLLTAVSVALTGLASAMLCRNPRPFELLLVLLAYLGVQGQGLLDIATDAATSIAQHALIAPAMAALVLLLWQRHTSARARHSVA